jgi:predicted aspartyl protease/tetratricopeptide (TPR) repeat protein
MDESDNEPRVAHPTRPAAWRLRGVAALAAATLVLALPQGAHARCKAESVELPVKMVGMRAIATVVINGTSVPLTVDSGAFFSILTDAAAAQLQLPTRRNPALRVQGLTGRVDARVTTVDRLQFLKGEFKGVDFVVGGNEPGAGTMGLMGRNILSVADTEYDLAHGMIRFLFPNDECDKVNLAYWADGAPVAELDLLPEFGTKIPSIRAKVKLNGEELTALFDTGAGTVVSLQEAKHAGVAEADLKPAGLIYGAGHGSAKAWATRFEKLEIGGETIRDHRLLVAEIESVDADMLLGIDFFLSHRIYISKQQSKMFFTYNGGPVFALDKPAVASAGTAKADPAAEDPDAATADDFARRGAASAARRDYEGALADLDRACALEPATAAYLAQRGAVQEALRRPAKALEDYDRALELDPAQVDARFQRAALRFVAKDRDGAAADLDALDRTIAPESQMRLPMSQLYLALARPAQALAELNQWLPAHPHEVRRDVALNRRCWARLLLGVELDRALDDCDDAVDADDKNPAYLDSRGWAYLRLGRFQKAVSDFDRALAARPALASSLYGRGLAKTRLGDAAQGDIDLAAARKLQPAIDQNLARIGLVTEAMAKQ